MQQVAQTPEQEEESEELDTLQNELEEDEEEDASQPGAITALTDQGLEELRIQHEAEDNASNEQLAELMKEDLDRTRDEHLTGTKYIRQNRRHVGPAISEYALDLDAWARRQGHDVLNACKPMKKLGLKESDVADCYGIAFEPFPQINTICENEIKRQFFEHLIQSPDFQSMHESTVLNHLASEIASIAVADKLSPLIKLVEQQQQQASKAGFDPNAKKKPGLSNQTRAAIAAASAAQNACQQVNDAVEACQTFGTGTDDTGKMRTAQTTKLFQAIRKDKTLLEISKIAGRYRRLAASRQRQRAIHGLDEIVGVEFGNDASKLLPHELALLCVDELEYEILRKYAERLLMQRESKATETVGKGPIVVAIDESGSMNGQAIINAKAFALALGWIARKQKRWCCFISWSDQESVTWTVMEPKKWDQDRLLKWLTHFYGGGTHPPLEKMPKIFTKINAPKGKTDIIMITDACCNVAEATKIKFNEWKLQQQVKMITMVLGAEAGDMSYVSDETHLINKISTETDAVSQALSI